MLKLPSLIYGTAWKKEKTKALVIQAIRTGFKGIDTACQPKHYAEAEVGKALAELNTQGYRREEIYLQTKFTPLSGQDPNTIPYDKHAPLASQVAQSFEISLKNLQTDYLDAYILHSPLFPFSHLLEVWRAMEVTFESGQSNHLGISNCYDLEVLKRLYEAATVKPSIVQNRFYDETAYDVDIRTWCQEHGITYESFWTLTANPHILNSETLTTVANSYGKSTAQIFFNYLHSVGISPLSGTTNQTHMKEDLESFDFKLSDSEQKRITELLQQYV